MMTSGSLDIYPNTIYEVILTTYDKNGTANAAPMGITFDKENKVIIRPFLQTKTFENLREIGECVINFTYSPELFVRATLFKEEFSSNNFKKSIHVNAPILLTDENNHIAVKIHQKNEDSEPERALFIGKIVHSNFNPIIMKPITRAFSSLLEILIHSTRVIHYTKVDGENNPLVNELMLIIDHHTDIIKRVTSEQIYTELLKKVLSKI